MQTDHCVLRFAAAALIAWTCHTTRIDAQPLTLEYRLKAALVSKLPGFVEWPPASIAGRDTINLCIAGSNPFGSELDQLIAGVAVASLPVAIRPVQRAADLAACHVLFIPHQPAGRRHPLLEQADGLPILTVGEDPSFLDDGGIIRMQMVQDRVQFDIDAGAARRAGLRISSQLLQLAANVRGNDP